MLFFVQYGLTDWMPTKAQSLSGAKRAASDRCLFQGQTLRVGVYDAQAERVVAIAVKPCDPITLVSQKWQDIERL